MAHALRLAELGLTTTHPNPRVGCVLVKDGTVIGTGWHHRTGEAHAEVVALQAASSDPRGAVCYVNLEPCSHFGRTPPCASALIEAQVSRVVIGMLDPNPVVAGRGAAVLRNAGIVVDTGVLAAEAQALNLGFWKRHTTGLPHVRLKLGASLDGRIAMASGESRWVTGAPARQDVQDWRARSAAVLTGIGTVLKDDPRLNVRAAEGQPAPERQPVRVLIDSRARCPAAANMLRVAGTTWLFAGETAARTAPTMAGLEIIPTPLDGSRINLRAMCLELARREINELWVEAGPTLSGALLQAGLVDELIMYVAPRVFGDAALPAFRLHGIDTLADSLQFRFSDVRHIGRDLRISLIPERTADLCSPA